jgi:hypothetical protein
MVTTTQRRDQEQDSKQNTTREGSSGSGRSPITRHANRSHGKELVAAGKTNRNRRRAQPALGMERWLSAPGELATIIKYVTACAVVRVRVRVRVWLCAMYVGAICTEGLIHVLAQGQGLVPDASGADLTMAASAQGRSHRMSLVSLCGGTRLGVTL